jgi:hypothetical protein
LSVLNPPPLKARTLKVIGLKKNFLSILVQKPLSCSGHQPAQVVLFRLTHHATTAPLFILRRPLFAVYASFAWSRFIEAEVFVVDVPFVSSFVCLESSNVSTLIKAFSFPLLRYLFPTATGVLSVLPH